MYGQNRNSGIYRLNNYEQALDWFNKTTPIRGNGCNAGVKPLGHRDRPHFQILKKEDNSIVCKCYQTDVVTFMPDGLIKLDSGGYMSQTTARFIYDVLGIGSCIEDHDIIIGLYGKRHRVGYGLEMRRVNDRYEVTKVAKSYVHTVNRKGMKKLRDEIAPFMQYLSGSIKVRGNDGFSEDERVTTCKALGYDKLDLSPVPTWRDEKSAVLARLHKFLSLVWSDDVENWYTASCWLAWSQHPWSGASKLNYATATESMNKILMATHAGALIKTEVPEGEVRRDRYALLTKLREAE